MLENCKTLKERWGGVTEIIDRWLDSRQDMLLVFCDLTTQDNNKIIAEDYASQLKNLCELLVDYISAGHFEVFQQLMEEGRAFGDDKAILEATYLLNQVHETTQKALDFNDKYLVTEDLDSITLNLATLGQNLAERFEAEDRMIEVLHTSHKEVLLI
jgi:regulator of sigma D